MGIYLCINKKKKTKKKKSHTVGRISKIKYQNRRNRGITNTPNTQIHEAYFPGLVQAFE